MTRVEARISDNGDVLMEPIYIHIFSKLVHLLVLAFFAWQLFRKAITMITCPQKLTDYEKKKTKKPSRLWKNKIMRTQKSAAVTN